MKEIIVISGKGGTGKTTVTAAFAAVAEQAVFADCDVDASDLHLVLSPDIQARQDFVGGKKARIDPDLCTACGECLDYCRFEAILSPEETPDATYRVDTTFCEGCGVCAKFCPSEAVVMEPYKNGEWYRSETRFGPMIHARLAPAEENSGRLVSLVRKEAKQLAANQGREWLIVDGPPGTGCPVIASLTGSDFAVLVTEPTVSGLHDLKRVCELTGHFQIPSALIVNKADLNLSVTGEIEGFASGAGVQLLGRLPYSNDAVRAQLEAKAVTELADSELANQIRVMWDSLRQLIEESRPDFQVLTTT